MADIYDVQQQVRDSRLFQRAHKGSDQMVRQLSDKAHGVDEQNISLIRILHAPNGGI